jgi:hypothetical protein
MLKVARRLVALQAQIPSTPFLSLAARVEGVTASDVEREISERKTLLRVWCLRLTLHVIATEDLPLLFAAVMRDGYEHVLGMMRRHDGLTTKEIRAAERAMLRALAKGPKTRSELRRDVPGFRVATYWGREVRCLAQKGLVVHAGRRGGEALFDLRERWAPRSTLGRMTARDARRELLLRYLAAYGPASRGDFAYWTGLGVRDVLPAFEDARAELREQDGFFVSRRDAGAVRGPLPERLLPRFDTLVLGHKDKSRYLDAKLPARGRRRALRARAREGRRDVELRRAGAVAPLPPGSRDRGQERPARGGAHDGPPRPLARPPHLPPEKRRGPRCAGPWRRELEVLLPPQLVAPHCVRRHGGPRDPILKDPLPGANSSLGAVARARNRKPAGRAAAAAGTSNGRDVRGPDGGPW